ncbi:uncharacterized protein PV09_07749 [Verruconis gallopava]|uniref:MICOS complex subunit mic19 n=1 Tax=Verruconis gallopava TaxID=253628 RepID=A0A0D2A1Y3_9PEZI|nr:uncharacterized protein PV09_07749 [Verruconis gallopava]KIW00768.1 hypothetical protein PV09_07749 [Verruconis gallopava]
MGAGNSKPEEGLAQHVFKADTPTRFSGDLVESLQDSSQSDATRSANLELKIQTRVTSELEKLAAEEEAKYKAVAESISKQAEETPSSDENPSLTDKLTGVAAEKERKAQLSHSSVSKEIADLRKKLESRKKIEQVDAGVEKAKEELVQCLRLNDRRPLDCWAEKEAFKREVSRLEREFVERTVR